MPPPPHPFDEDPSVTPGPAVQTFFPRGSAAPAPRLRPKMCPAQEDGTKYETCQHSRPPSGRRPSADSQGDGPPRQPPRRGCPWSLEPKPPVLFAPGTCGLHGPGLGGEGGVEDRQQLVQGSYGSS